MKDYEVENKGVLITLGKKDYIVPPLNFDAIELFEERIENMPNLTVIKQVSLMVDICHCAILRNYPDVTRKEVAKFLDFTNISDVFTTVMASSGLVGTAQEAGVNESGEVKK